MASPTDNIDSPAPRTDRPTLAARVDAAVCELLRKRMPPEVAVRPFDDPDPVEPPYVSVRSLRVTENEGRAGGVWLMSVEIRATGEPGLPFGVLDTIETLLASAQTVDCAIRDIAADHGFVLPGGVAVDFDLGGGGAQRSASELDFDWLWNFSLWCQAQEINAVAA